MRIPGLKHLRYTGRWLRSRFVSGALILGYHRVAESPSNPYSICVSPQHFGEHLAVLRQYARPIRLRDLVQQMQVGSPPPQAVALTFDDGYKDHLLEAKPILEKHAIPATVFVTTGYFDSDFWWNELEEVLFQPAQLPRRLSILVKGEIFEWAQDVPLCSNKRGDGRRHLLLALHRRMLGLTQQQQQELLAQIRKWTGAECFRRQSSALARDEVVQLASGDLIDIGAHSVTHPFLDSLPPVVQKFEIRQSKASLEKLLGCQVDGFSYPHGAASGCSRALVEEAGFLFACASHNDIARRGRDRFHLPRFWVPDCDGPTFARWLRRWLRR